MNKYNKLSVIIFSTFRLASCLWILYQPLAGFIAFTFFDFADGYLFVNPGLSRNEYYRWDRFFDFLGYLPMLYVSSQFGFFIPMFLLIIFRSIGHLLYLRTKKLYFYILFPDFFVFVFLWIVINNIYKLSQDLSLYLLVFLIILKLVQELLVHYFRPMYVKRFGQPEFLVKIGFPKVVR